MAARARLTRSENRLIGGVRPGLAAVLAYVAIGVATADLALAATGRARSAWRLAAWVLSLLVFLMHVGYERLKLGSGTSRTARHAALAVAAGAFALALVGPAASHWGEPGFARTALLSVVLWPILTGIPAFVAAVGVAVILSRLRTGGGVASETRAATP